ncbi:T9SS type A sorting domain-containing protein [Aquimarina algiphila]|uniref:T9SS type A sorting domain-containing protein n=1 Tax=Aquimarina algiphila TaxID=2047982 RepID=UPI00248FE49F|nr:T9SS type A sorting domain-containing protein [Aquimarina algiphila]
MRKFLLLMLFIACNTFAQDYQLIVSGYIGSGPSSCGSNNNGLKWIKAIFDDGSEDFLFNQPGGQFRNRTYSFSQVYSENKRLVGVKFRSVSRRRSSFGSCRSSRSSEKLVNVSSPSFHQVFTKNEIYESRINNGSATITVVQTINATRLNQNILLTEKNENILSNQRDKESKLFKTSMYPNPSLDGKFSINISSKELTPIVVQIFDLVDRRKVFEEVKSGNTEYVFEFNSYPLKSGFYLVQVESGGKKQLKKLIIE